MWARLWDRISWGLAPAAAAAFLHWTLHHLPPCRESQRALSTGGEQSRASRGILRCEKATGWSWGTCIFIQGLVGFVHFGEDGAVGSRSQRRDTKGCLLSLGNKKSTRETL